MSRKSGLDAENKVEEKEGDGKREEEKEEDGKMEKEEKANEGEKVCSNL